MSWPKYFGGGFPLLILMLSAITEHYEKFNFPFLQRLLLAAMHYNENSDRDPATTQTGERMYSIDFPRAKGGDYTLREVQSPATFGEYTLLKYMKKPETNRNLSIFGSFIL